MSSNPSDVLGTVFLFVLVCAISFIAFGNLVANEKPGASCTTLSRHHVEPQVVLSAALWSFDLPPFREAPEPTFEPRPEPEPLPRRNGLVPRAERRVRPVVFAERRGQRERHMTEISTRERVASADKEAAREACEAHKEQERFWRSKAIAHEEAEAASMTGGSLATESGLSEQKQLSINMGAVDSYPRTTRRVQIERPDHEGSNAFTGTALGDKMGTAYAPSMEGVEGAGAVQPLVGKVQESDHALANNTSMALEENSASKQSLAGEVQEANDVAAGHSKTTAETLSDNPLLKMSDEDAAEGRHTELSTLQEVKANNQADDAWDRQVLWVYTSWYEWITCDNTLRWHFDKLNEAQIRYLKPMVDEVFATFKTRCGKRKTGLPADALDGTLAIVSAVRDGINEALKASNGSNTGQYGPQDQPSAITEQSTDDVQFLNDEQLSHNQKQIAQDRWSAEVLEQQLLQEDTQIASDHEVAKSLNQLQQQQQKEPLHQQKYIQDDIVDQQTRTRTQNYPAETVASGSGTYPRKEWAIPRVKMQVSDPPAWPVSPTRPEWLPKPVEGLPRHEVVTLVSEEFAQGPEYTPAGDDMIVHTERINTGPINTLVEDATITLEERSNTGPVKIPANPLLEQHPSQAWEMLGSWLNKADTSFETLTNDKAEEWFQNLNTLLIYWSEMMEGGGREIWIPVEGCDVLRLADFASRARQLIEEEQFGAATCVSENVCKWMDKARDYVETHMQRQHEEQALMNEDLRQESMIVAQMQQQQQQQLAQKLNPGSEEDNAKYRREPAAKCFPPNIKF